ncbi:plasmid pRiA4b ORF-3 family protein [Pirellulaceae bacterium SH449]
MSNQQIKVMLSSLERNEIAALLPELSESMKLGSKNGRVIPLSMDEAKSILHASKIDKRENRGVVINCLAHVTQVISNAMEEAQGIGAIPITERLYQFKITLLGYKPLIWRRIQVKSCTLDKLHEYIQTAMGWTNSHLHQFEISGERYGDPDLLNDSFDKNDSFYDSTSTMLHEVIPKSGKRFQFEYEYDFGDCWKHEIAFEGCLKSEKGVRYPVCLEGENACPPEDVGGVNGYADFLEAIADPNHEQHEDLVQWGGKFDPMHFDAVKTTNKIRRGLPNWRRIG